jgi:hypothetical protein
LLTDSLEKIGHGGLTLSGLSFCGCRNGSLQFAAADEFDRGGLADAVSVEHPDQGG